MTNLFLTFACGPYDRILPLACGMVKPEGITLNYLPMGVIEVFWRQIRHQEFDASECSLSSYVTLRSRGDDRFIAIPVYTSRVFRHAALFINTRKDITSPQDLRGKIVGTSEYQVTAAVWIRGILQDEYGVSPKDVTWRTGGQEMPGRVEKIEFHLPPAIRLEPIPAEKTLSQMLEDGELDALIALQPPSPFLRGSHYVKRLFDNYLEVEEQYYKKTKIFPIMHTVVIKKEIYKANPWIAMSLYKAFCQAKDIAVRACMDPGTLHVTLPWVNVEVRHTQKIMGQDWWPYGIDKNRKTLETFLRYHHEQGLSSRLMSVDELFAPETLDEFKV